MKKLISAVLSLVLALGTLSLSASAETNDGVSLIKETAALEDDSGSIVEIVTFDASRSTSEEVRRQIMMINSDIADSIAADADVATRSLGNEGYEGTFEIRAYTFESDRYLQYIGTSIEYPTYGRDPYAYSFVYDRVNKKYVRLSDALIEDGLTEDEILTDAEKLYFAAGQEYLFGGKVVGFFMLDDNTRSYILRMNKITPVADEWITLMTYTPSEKAEGSEEVLCERVELAEEFMPTSVGYSDTDHTNDILMNVKYEADSGDYIRFMRDRYAIIKIGEKRFAVFYYRNLDIITFSTLTKSFEGTLKGGNTLTVTIDGEERIFTAK
jgi:hypothetical protein